MATKTRDQRDRERRAKQVRKEQINRFAFNIGYYSEPTEDKPANAVVKVDGTNIKVYKNKNVLGNANSLEELLEAKRQQSNQDQKVSLDASAPDNVVTQAQRKAFKINVGGGSAPRFLGDVAPSRTGFRI